MKKIAKLLVACLLQSAVSALGTFEEKTFLLPHNPVHTFMLEQALWSTHRHNPALQQNGHIQVTGFYGSSVNHTAIGSYFGIGNDANFFQVGPTKTLNRLLNLVIDADTELDGGYLIHDQAHANTSNLTGKVTFKPEQTIYGVNVGYHQTLQGHFKNIFFQVAVPIVQAVNNMGFSVADQTSAVIGLQSYSLADFYAGKVNVAAGVNAQAPLKAGKIVARNLTATGIADINLKFGYKIVCTQDTHIDFFIRTLIPTGNKSTGEYLFEPLVGNNGHFGIGGGLDADLSLWHNDDCRLSLQASGQYTYLLESNEIRMAGISTRTDDNFKYNHYVAVASPGVPLNGQPILAPAANLLTQQFFVRPGSQLEFLAGMGFHAWGLTMNLGYNFNWREKESVYQKNQALFSAGHTIVGKGATMNAQIPGVPNTYVGVLTPTSVAPIFTAAVNPGDGAIIEGAQAAAIFGGAAADGAGLGTAAGAGRLAGNAAQLAAYQAGAKLYAATGYDVLQSADGDGAHVAVADAAIAAAGIVQDGGAPAAGADGALAVATAARNLVQDLQRANISLPNSIRQESLITHVVGVSLGYSLQLQPGYPLLLGLGAQYDLPHSTNAGLESWKVFGKLGLSF